MPTTKKTSAVLTVTHNRPTAFSYLERFMKAQTYQDFDWYVVVDEGADEYKFRFKQRVTRRDPIDDTMPSICHNMLAGLEQVGGYEHVFLVEDDDLYTPNYLFETKNLLEQTDLFGWAEDAYYYVLSRRAKRWHNTVHASLACTAFSEKALDWVRRCCQQGHAFIDMLVWRGWKETKQVQQTDGKMVDREIHHGFKGKTTLAHNFTGLLMGKEPKLNREGNVPNEHPRHVGMKEPWHQEEPGLSKFGHTPDGGFDVLGTELQKWIGEEEAQRYLKFTTTPKPGTPFILYPMPSERD